MRDAEDGGLRRERAPGQPGLAARGGEARPTPTHRDYRCPGDLPRQGDAIVADGDGWQAQPGLGDGIDGLPAGLARRSAFGPIGSPASPASPPDAPPVNKLKALGNSIAPQVAYELIAAMRSADR